MARKFIDNELEFEPFDTRLASRISTLHGQIESLNLDLANRRRTAAQLAAKNFREGFAAHSETLEAASLQRAADAANDKSSMEAIASLQAPNGWKERQEDIRRTWETTLDDVGRLQGSIAQASGRGQKATEVLDYLDSR